MLSPFWALHFVILFPLAWAGELALSINLRKNDAFNMTCIDSDGSRCRVRLQSEVVSRSYTWHLNGIQENLASYGLACRVVGCVAGMDGVIQIDMVMLLVEYERNPRTVKVDHKGLEVAGKGEYEFEWEWVRFWEATTSGMATWPEDMEMVRGSGGMLLREWGRIERMGRGLNVVYECGKGKGKEREGSHTLDHHSATAVVAAATTGDGVSEENMEEEVVHKKKKQRTH